MSELLSAIDDYLEQSRRLLDRLRVATGATDLMGAWRSKQLAKSGKIDNLNYEFHGVGVYIEANGDCIQIDFLPGGKEGGFDSWRLWQFVKRAPEKYRKLDSETAIIESSVTKDTTKVWPVASTRR